MSLPSEVPTERQVLYALVAGGFVIVVAVLVLGAAFAGLVPVWWTTIGCVATIGVGGLSAVKWKETQLVLLSSIMLFLAWVVGTLLVT